MTMLANGNVWELNSLVRREEKEEKEGNSNERHISVFLCGRRSTQSDRQSEKHHTNKETDRQTFDTSHN